MKIKSIVLMIFIYTKMKIKVDIRSSKLGILWLLMQPLLYLAIYYISFRYILKSKDVASIISCLIGLISYNWFSQVLNEGTVSLIGSKGVTNSTTVPPFIFIISSALVCLWRYIFVLLVFLVFISFYSNELVFSLNFLFLLPIILLGFLTFLCITFFLASFYPIFPDIKHFVDTFVKLLLFISCVFYEVQSVPSKFSDFFLYNPLSSLITNLRTIILGHSFYGMNFLLCNTVICAVFLICGIFLYNLNKKKFPYINTI